jgi:hypothetical protein
LIEKTPEIKTSSPRRIAASRANGAKSRGPITAKGKERSSRNAIKHGLASATIVLTTEDWPNYLQCREAFIQRFQPADDVELDLVEEMVAARWRQQRMWALESAALDDEIDAQRANFDQTYSAITPDVRTALAFTKLADESRGLALIGRYEARYSRQFYRALKALKELQSNRPPAPAPTELTTDNRQLTTEKLPNEPNPNPEHTASAPPPPSAPLGASRSFRTDNQQLTTDNCRRPDETLPAAAITKSPNGLSTGHL